MADPTKRAWLQAAKSSGRLRYRINLDTDLILAWLEASKRNIIIDILANKHGNPIMLSGTSKKGQQYKGLKYLMYAYNPDKFKSNTPSASSEPSEPSAPSASSI